MYFRRFFLLILAVAAAILPVHAADTAAPGAYPYARETKNPTALDRYVAKPDTNYRWKVVLKEHEDGLTSYTIDMTSQQWRTAAEVANPIWRHWVTICVPDTVAHPTAFLYIEGGSNGGREPRKAGGDVKRVAQETGTIAAAVFMIPNQPVIFTDMKGFGRSEDAFIAYTWDKFLRTGDEEWPARLPMTKAVVRAMDTIQTFCASAEGGGHAIKDFVVAGASKRGWTTWTTAIVDTRVRAIIPCVIDLLNLSPSFQHHFAVYGHWSIFVGDYQALHVLDWMGAPEYDALMRIIEPYEYRDRLTMPKLIMNGANDQFFLPDSSQFYWDDLQGPKWLRYFPNAGHGLDDTALDSAIAFHAAIVAGTPIPAYSFSFEKDGAITVQIEPASDGAVIQPIAVKLWQAHNPKKRDFRGNTAKYVASELAPVAPGVYRAEAPVNNGGYTAYLVQLTFPGATPELPFRFTSGVRVTPEEPPFKYIPPANPPKGFLTGK